MREDVAQELRGLEERLLTRGVRSSEAELARLLAEDFCEFGASGRVFDRDAIVDVLRGEAETHDYVVEDFSVRRLGASAALATYRLSVSGIESRTSLRSSIWVRRDDRWQLVFHQGTRRPPGAA